MSAKVVVIGGGLGGGHVSKLLEDAGADVTLIDQKDYFEITWATLRLLVEPSLIEKVIFLHSDYLHSTKIVKGTVTAVTKTHVSVATESAEASEDVPYDFLVVASGSAASPPLTLKAKGEWYKEAHAKLEAAGSVLIIGGGPTGVELAGEIVTDYPDKKVTLVHSRSSLLEFLKSPKASQRALDWLKAKNVEVILGEKVEVTDEAVAQKKYTTSGGKEIQADLHFSAIRSPFDSSYLRGEFGSHLDERGRVKVDPTLRLAGIPNVFAIGDVTALDEPKQGYLAGIHAGIVAANIKKLANEPTPKKGLKTYKPASAPIAMVSLGRNSGVGVLPLFGVVGGWVVKNIKSKGLFIDKVRGELKVK